MGRIFRIHLKRLCLIALILISTVGCDQVTKLVARDSFSLTGPITYFGGIIRLEHWENPGAFLSLGANLPESLRFIFLTVIVGLLLAGAAFYLFKYELNLWNTVGLSLMVGGGIGNLIDRAIQGTVTDFMSIGVGSLRTGIFNVADVAIMVGVSILILYPTVAKSNAELRRSGEF